MDLGLPDGEHGGEYIGLSFAETFQIFVTHDSFFFETEPFDRTLFKEVIIYQLVAR